MIEDDEAYPSLATDLHVQATQRLTEALIEAENRSRRRIELLSEVVFETDGDGCLVYLNTAWHSLLGMRPEESLGQRLETFIEEADRARLRELMSGSDGAPLAAGQRTEFRARRVDGAMVWIDLSLARLPGGATVGVFHDITAQRLAQDELAKLSLVASYTDNLVIITDARGRIEWVNPAFVARTGYSLQMAAGWTPGALLQGGETDRAAVGRIREAILAGRPIREELVNYTQSREPYWVALQISPIRNARGVVTQFVSVQTDVTERKRIEQEILEQKAALEDRVLSRTAELALAKEVAEEALRARSAFVANMSHEIRTPLNAIIGMTYLGLQDSNEAAQRERLRKIEQAGRSLMAIVNDILDFSKIEAGAMVLEAVPFSLSQVLDNVDTLVGDTARAKGLAFSWSVADEVPVWLEGDPVRLQQVFVNIAGNAVKFTSRGSVQVEVGLRRRTPSWVELECRVTDTGIGLTEAQCSRLFRAFSQADSSTTRIYGGTGLGLAISKRLVESMQGGITVASVPDEGSVFTFTVWLGIQEGPAHGMADPPQDASMEQIRECLQGARILVAEDNEFNQQVVRELLERMGATVILAGTGREAVERLREDGPFSLVLMDVQMPELDGYEASRMVRSELGLRDLPIIAMTANVTKEDEMLCLDAGMNDFQPKPIQLETFYKTVARWARTRRVLVNGQVTRAADDGASASARGRGTSAVRAEEMQLGAVALDMPALLALAGGNAGMAQQIARLYVVTTRATHCEMLEKLRHGDLQALGRLGHKLKAASAQVGAAPIVEASAALEQLGVQARSGSARAFSGLAEATMHVQRIGSMIALLEATLGTPA